MQLVKVHKDNKNRMVFSTFKKHHSIWRGRQFVARFILTDQASVWWRIKTWLTLTFLRRVPNFGA